MIIELLLDVLYGVFAVLTSPIDIPNMPEQVSEFVSASLEYIGTGISILSNFCDIQYLLTLFGLIIAVDVGLMLYKLVMWVLKKIPMIGVQ